MTPIILMLIAGLVLVPIVAFYSSALRRRSWPRDSSKMHDQLAAQPVPVTTESFVDSATALAWLRSRRDYMGGS